MEDCISHSNDISDPKIYTLIFHILTCIGLPVHAYGGYCILFKTPSQMSSIKWFMLNCHFWNAVLDLCISFLSIPFIFHPSFSGVALGILDFPELEVYLVLALFGLVTVSIWSIYENRYYVLFGKDGNVIWCWIRKPLMIVNYSAAVAYFAPPFFVLPDQNEAFRELKRTLPCHLQPSYEGRKVFILSANPDLPFYCVLFFYALTVCQCIPIFAVLLTKLIVQSRKKLSAVSSNTLRLRKKFVIALVIQTISPCVLISFPVEYLVIATHLKFYNRSINCLSMILLSLHGICSTLTMILIHQPYRDATIDNIYFLIRWKRQMDRKKRVAPVTIQL